MSNSVQRLRISVKPVINVHQQSSPTESETDLFFPTHRSTRRVVPDSDSDDDNTAISNPNPIIVRDDGSETSHLKSTKRPRNAMASTPPPSPNKKRLHISSAISEGLTRMDSDDAPIGLFRFMKKCTPEEYDERHCSLRLIGSRTKLIERPERCRSFSISEKWIVCVSRSIEQINAKLQRCL